MQESILLVDDDENLLLGCQRNLRQQFSIQTARSGAEAIEHLSSGRTFAVVVADMQMPGMDGIDLLRRTRAMAPETVRIMLTGNSEQKTAAAAVNDGQVFRFLSKPCSTDAMALAIQAGLHHYHLRQIEREVLANTLNGAVRILTDVLSVVDPDSFGRGRKLQEQMHTFLQAVTVENGWELELAAMLSSIGRVALPAAVLNKQRGNVALSLMEEDMLHRVPEIGAALLEKIPRLENVAQIVRLQHKRFGSVGIELPLGARVLKVLGDLADLVAEGLAPRAAMQRLRQRHAFYDPAVLAEVVRVFDLALPATNAPRAVISRKVEYLRSGQILAEDVRTLDGVALLLSGTTLSPLLIERLGNFHALGSIPGTLLVLD